MDGAVLVREGDAALEGVVTVELVALPEVLGGRQVLQVPGRVEAADERVLEGNDVVDLVAGWDRGVDGL